LQGIVKGLIAEDLVVSAHDCADGGLFITLMEAAMPNNLGFEVNTDSDFRKDAYLFGEAQSRVVVSVSADQEEKFVEVMAASDVPFSLLGEVKGDSMLVDDENYGKVSEVKAEFESALENYLTK
jgi:phosphoribosylformylglycinamidine synthase